MSASDSSGLRKSVPVPSTGVGFRARPWPKPRRDVVTRLRHDLRSAVHALLGYSNLLVHERHGSLTHEQQRFAGYVRAAAVDVEQLVDMCVELLVPPDLEPAREVELKDALVSVQRKLATSGYACADVALHPVPPAGRKVGAERCERALLTIARAVRESSGDGQLALHVLARDGALVWTLFGDGAEGELGAVDATEHEIENRAFVRFKLGEVLLERLAGTLRVTADGRRAEITFR